MPSSGECSRAHVSTAAGLLTVTPGCVRSRTPSGICLKGLKRRRQAGGCGQAVDQGSTKRCTQYSSFLDKMVRMRTTPGMIERARTAKGFRWSSAAVWPSGCLSVWLAVWLVGQTFASARDGCSHNIQRLSLLIFRFLVVYTSWWRWSGDELVVRRYAEWRENDHGDGSSQSGNNVSPYQTPAETTKPVSGRRAKLLAQSQSSQPNTHKLETSLDPRPRHPPRHSHCLPRRRGRRVGQRPSFIMSRPPRAQRPQSHQQQQLASPPLSPSQQHESGLQSGITFQEYESGDRAAPLPASSRQRRYSAAIEDPQSLDARVSRKRSLVRPERERIEPGHRQYHYRNMAAQLDEHGTRHVMPSSMPSFSQSPLPCSPLFSSDRQSANPARAPPRTVHPRP